MKNGDIILLENVRFHAGETKNDKTLSKKLAELGDIFVNDAFGTAHRAHSSTVGVTEHLQAVGGYLMAREIDFLGRIALHVKELVLIVQAELLAPHTG